MTSSSDSPDVPPRHTHFVGFRGDEYTTAVRLWGRPHFIYMGWDTRARREIQDGDLVVFATGDADQVPREKNWPDLNEKEPLYE